MCTAGEKNLSLHAHYFSACQGFWVHVQIRVEIGLGMRDVHVQIRGAISLGMRDVCVEQGGQNI